MLFFTTTNAVLLALMQVGVIVAGALIAGLSHKLWAVNDMAAPPLTLFLVNYGFVGLIIPLVWTAVVFRLRQRSNIPDAVKGLAFLSGIVILFSLVIFIFVGVMRPVFGIGNEL